MTKYVSSHYVRKIEPQILNWRPNSNTQCCVFITFWLIPVLKESLKLDVLKYEALWDWRIWQCIHRLHLDLNNIQGIEIVAFCQYSYTQIELRENNEEERDFSISSQPLKYQAIQAKQLYLKREGEMENILFKWNSKKATHPCIILDKVNPEFFFLKGIQLCVMYYKSILFYNRLYPPLQHFMNHV